jgi:hypothetical protein
VSPPGPRLLYCGAALDEARGLRDAGHEVVVLADDVSVEQLAAVAVQEDVGAVAVSDTELGARTAARLGGSVVVFWVTSDSAPS